MEKTLLSPITLLIADDYEVNRLGLRVLFESEEDFKVLGDAANGVECVRATLQLKPDIVIMDIQMPLLSGIDATRQIKESAPETKIIMLTSHSDDTSVMSSLQAGAEGYCLKHLRSPQLMAAVRAVANGACWLDSGIASVLLRATTKTSKEQKLDTLTDTELNVLRLVVEGLDNQEISKHLHIGHDSIKLHMRHILKKMAVPSRTQAAVKAVREGLI